MTWTKDEFEKLYARFTESGLSIRDFCFNEGIPESRFYYWKKRVVQEPKYELQKADGSFLPVNVTQKDGKITNAEQDKSQSYTAIVRLPVRDLLSQRSGSTHEWGYAA